MRATLPLLLLSLLIAGRAHAAETAARTSPAGAPDVSDLAYGDDPRQRLDLWHASGAGPAPLCIYFHGGGFKGGDKAEIVAARALALRKAGFVVASANYRFGALPTPLRDGARVVQFLRAHAAEHGIDPRRVAAFGASAGAVISLWVGFHDDLAQADVADPVARQSSRLQAVGSIDGQTSLDPHDLKAWFGIASELNRSTFLSVFGLPRGTDLETPEVRTLVAGCSPYGQLTTDDPPVWIQQNATDPRDLLHSPEFGRRLAARMTELGMPVGYNAGTGSFDQQAATMARLVAGAAR